MAGQALLAPVHDIAGVTEVRMPAVLVVDNDPDCLSHCSTMLRELGYRHYCSATPREALERLADDASTQIVFAGMQMPVMNGVLFIEEARVRVADGRALAAILLTDKVTVDLAIKGLHIGAVDVLGKPLGFDTYSMALRRAMGYLATLRATATNGATMLEFSQQLVQLVSALEGKSLEPKAEDKLTDKEVSATLRTIIGSRGMRNRFLPGDLFADPAWDILLDLTKARLENRQVSVSSVCIAASVPMSTALRWVRQMTEAGLLRRWTDPKDRRRDLIALTDPTAGQMREYLSSVYALLKKI
jgi:CheY-like chemotaxis protein